MLSVECYLPIISAEQSSDSEVITEMTFNIEMRWRVFLEKRKTNKTNIDFVYYVKEKKNLL